MRISQNLSDSPPKTPAAQPEKPGKAQRSDGALARSRLLHCALKLFAEKGFAKTSTREIALAAGANVAAISYYFGDKAGLYEAVFIEPLGSPKDDIVLYDQAHFSLRQSLEGFYTSFLEPMKQGELVQHCMRLHFRELLEPTGLWQQEIEQSITPAHAALIRVLCRNMNLARADDDLHRLAFAIEGMALHVFVGRDVIQTIRPRLIGSPSAINLTAQRLADFAQNMVEGERARRALLLDGRAASSAPVMPLMTAKKTAIKIARKTA